MELKILSNSAEEEFINCFQKQMDKIPDKIKLLLEQRNIEFIILDEVYDIMDNERKQTQQKIYKDELHKKRKTRGLCSDTSNCIAISCKYTQIEHIPAILYHELGHFLDAYENFGKVDELGLSLSSKPEFIEAYDKDFIEHYELFKDKVDEYLVHFVQQSNPKNISNIGRIETFAEVFRWAHNLENNVKTVELYFPTTLKVVREIVNETFNLVL